MVATITRRSDADVHNVHDSDELSVGDVIVTVNGIDTSTLTNATLRALVGNAQDVELEIATADQLAAATHSAQQQEPAATAAATDEAHEEMDAELNPDNIHRTCAVERGRGRGSNVGGTHALPAGNATGNRSPDGRQGAAVDSQPVGKEDDEVDKEGEVAAEDGDEEEEEAGAEEVAMLMQLQSLDIVDRLTATDPDDGSPLMIAAARRGWAAVVKQFVVHGGNPNVLDHVTGLTPLLAAARSGAANTVRALVKSGAALDVTHRENGATALVTASFHGHVKVVEILLGAGANPLLLTRATGASALFVAALCGWSRVVDLLCKHPNVEPSFRGHDSGATPAYAAAKNGHTAVLAVLTRYGADLTAGPQSPHVNMTPVFAACENGHANAVVYMMEHGVDVADLRGYGGMSPLHAAVWHGHVHVVRALYAKCGYSGAGGAADNGMYALHIAAEAGDSHLDLIGILVRRGTSINLQTAVRGETALYLAARNGHQKVVAWLLEEGASPSIPTLAIPEMELSSVVPLHAAATNGHLDVLRMLANAGANLNVQAEPGGETACYTAAHDGRAKALALLADMGADVQLPARDGSTPIYIAAGRGKESCVRCLAALRADLSAKIEGIGVTPAFIAARFGHLTVLVILALQAADLQLRTEHGDACVQVARKYRHAQVVRFLSKLASLTGAARAAYIRKVERKARVNNECMQIAPPLSANADVRALPEHGLGQRKQHWTLEKRNNLSRVQKTAASNAGVLAAPVPRESSNVGYARDPPQPSIRRNSRYCQ